MTHKALEEYFHLIVNKPLKETTMLAALKAKWKEFWNFGYTWVEEPVEGEEGWAFVIKTDGYKDLDEGLTVEAKYDVIQGDNDGTWMETLDQILDVLGKHYGYNIKEQVYYSVVFPQNNPEFAGYGRELNDEILQQLLLSFPEVYKAGAAQE